MKPMTIVIPFLNEGEEPRRTIESIFDTTDSSLFKIIAVDDCSDEPCDLTGFNDLRYVRNRSRIGSGASKHRGGMLTDTPYIFIIDAHMRFKNDNWLIKILECLEKNKNTIYCTTCLGLDEKNMDVYKAKGKYCGANLLMYGNQAPGRPAREVLEPKWASAQGSIEYEIPCILGANYGFTKSWFNKIQGIKGLKMWGSEEPFWSLKTWLAGGDCRIRTDIEIGHKFRTNAPYATHVYYLIYNKIYIFKTIFPEYLAEKLIDQMPRGQSYDLALNLIKKNSDEIEKDRRYYKSIFTRTIEEYCERFNVALP